MSNSLNNLFVRDGWKGIAQRTCMRYVASMCSCWLAVIQVNGGQLNMINTLFMYLL